MEQKPASASQPVDAGQFQIGMRALAGAGYIIPSFASAHRYGRPATAVCSASAEPPTVLACINKLASTHNAVAKGKVFCVNVLRSDDWQLSTTFSGGQSGDARFKHGNWARLATGSPVLVDALVSFDCRVVKSMAHGTHSIFLGQVEQMLIGQKGKPLLYSDGQYAKLASLTLGEPLPEGLDYWGF